MLIKSEEVMGKRGMARYNNRIANFLMPIVRGIKCSNVSRLHLQKTVYLHYPE